MLAGPSFLTQLLTRIGELQSAGSPTYAPGLFPSWRCKTALRYRREDSNVFFTALVAFTLREIGPRLPAAAQAVADAIAGRARAAYPLYQNRHGLPIYNFYQTRPLNHFPNGRLLGRLRHFATPDDVDSTTLVYLSAPRPTPDNHWLKTKLQAHANTVKGQASTAPPAFRRRKIYSTWFGELMPIELDVCTLSNAMLWVLRTGLPLNEFDHDTLAYIDWVIASGEYRRRPLGVAAYYATAPLIAYHAGRLLAGAQAPQLAASRAALLRDLPALLAEPRPFMERVLLGTTLLRLGATPPPLSAALQSLAELEAQTRGFYFFIAPLLNYYPHTRWLARWRLSQIDWECPAHSLVLVAEYVALGGR